MKKKWLNLCLLIIAICCLALTIYLFERAIYFITSTLAYDGNFTIAIKNNIRNLFILGFLSLISCVLSSFILIKMNFNFENLKQRKKERKEKKNSARKAERISELEKELNELKKGGE